MTFADFVEISGKRKEEMSENCDQVNPSPNLGSLHKIDCESLNSLVHQYDQALEENFTKRNQFQKLGDDYTKLKARLKTLPDKLEYEAMVPLCSKALCPGKIIHTNEILVLLGENTFVECTSKKAAEIIKHRLKKVDDTLNRLEKERELYNSWKLEAERQMVETLGDGTIEIVEDYDEEKELEWRKVHRENVRKHHQELGKKRKILLSSNVVNNVGKTGEEEKLWTRLDALELEEEFMEAQAIYEQRITEPIDPNDSSKCTVKIRERAKSKLSLPEAEFPIDNKDADSNANNSTSGKKVTFSPDNIIHNLTDLSIRDFKKKGKDTECPEQKEEVELYKPSNSSDNGLYDPIFIRFRHEAFPSPDDIELVSSDSDSDDDVEYQIVLSPGDIYEQFGPPSLEAKSIAVPGADKSPLKSILKPRGQQECTEGGRSDSKISHKELCTTTNVNVKKTLCEMTSALAEQVTERMPGDSVTNDNYPALPELAPESNVIHLPNKECASGASINIAVAGNTKSNSNRPVSLFKRMKSGERALSTDSTN